MKNYLLSFTIIYSLLVPIISSSQAPNLGTASSFAVFTSAGAFDNLGTTKITGNIGTHVGALTGFPPGIVYGQTHVADATSLQCSTDVATAYNDLFSRTCGVVISVTLGNNQTLTPNTYCTGAASTLNGTLILDGQGNPNAVFIFKIGGAFSTSASSNISLINSATLCNVYWQVGGAFSLGASSVFRGAILVDGAVSLLEGSAIYGQVLSKAGEIDLHNNIVLKSAIPPGYTHSWNGSADTNWNNAGNWCPTTVPTIADGAYIHFVNNQPTIVSSTYSVNNIGVDSLAVLTIDSNATLAITNSIISEGNIVGLGNLIKNGSSADTISGVVTIANLTINNIAGTSIRSGSANAVSITNALTVTGALTTNANLTLISTASGTSRVAESYGSINGLVTVQRYIPPRRAWRLLTVPLRGNGVSTLNSSWQTNNGSGVLLFAPTGSNGFTAGGQQANIRSYDPNLGWTSLSGTTTNNILDADAGGTTAKNKTFAVFVTAPHGSNASYITTSSLLTTIKTTGKIVTGQQDFTVSTIVGQNNLIGNPYPSPIDLDAFLVASPNNTNITAVAYVFNPNGGTVGQYITVTRILPNTFTYVPDNSVAYRYIQSGQGFFTTSAGAGATISFQESHKVSNSITTVFRPGNGGLEKLAVNMSFQNQDNSWQIADGVAAIYDNNYSKSVTDEFDASKFTNPNETVSLIRNGKNMAIEARPLIDTYDTSFMNLAQMRAYSYKFDFMPSNMQTSGLVAFLQDAYKNIETAISLSANSAYQFVANSDAGSFASNRFRIVYRPTIPLTVNFNGIKAFQKQAVVKVEWLVSSEINLYKYEVEKSNISLKFEPLTNVFAKGNSTTETSYEIFDSKPFSGFNFYRIKAIDKNGEFKYSETIKVNFGIIKSSISVYPNPSKGDKVFVSLDNLPNGKYELKVLNNLGQEIYTKSILTSSSNNQQTINTQNWVKGVYNISIVGVDTQLQQSIIKQ